MNARNSSGFTIIETVLFLGVTGLLVLGVMIGTGTSLNNQRYRDAVETFKDVIQQQYADLGSIRNGRSNTWNCDAAARPTTGGTEIRGQSNCFIVGKYVGIVGSDISIYTVLARKTANHAGEDVVQLNRNYSYNIVPSETDTMKMEWGTQIAWPRSGTGSRPNTTPRSIALFFVRSPTTGAVYTFSSDTVVPLASINSATFTNMIQPGTGNPGQGQRTICIDGGGLFSGGNTALNINSYAAGPSAVEVRSNDILSLTGTTRC